MDLDSDFICAPALFSVLAPAPVVFAGQHLINAALGLGMLALIVAYTLTQSNSYFAAMLALMLTFRPSISIGALSR